MIFYYYYLWDRPRNLKSIVRDLVQRNLKLWNRKIKGRPTQVQIGKNWRRILNHILEARKSTKSPFPRRLKMSMWHVGKVKQQWTVLLLKTISLHVTSESFPCVQLFPGLLCWRSFLSGIGFPSKMSMLQPQNEFWGKYWKVWFY